MFLTEQDYKVVIGEAALKVVTQADPDARAAAEEEAVEEAAGYLRPKYDVNVLFAGGTAWRSRILVMIVADIALYHLVASQPQKLGSEVRRERYERAIKWLEGVQRGTIVPDLPLADASPDEADGSTTLFSSQKKLRHNW
jgi:phage gp36-like protein